jgi:formate hydrogenlyase subunit 3/multisubunit Na+/H+ antiporter MnhD subunit
MLLYAILAAVLAIAAIFLTPLRYKVWTATALIGLASISAIALAVNTLSNGAMELMRFSTIFFGNESFSVDPLSSLFLVIIAVASIATVIYSRGYVEGYLKRFSPAHISLHYTALVTLVVSMMAVVLSSGGFSFLFSWEMMTIASFILILFEAERQDVRRAALNYLVMMHIGFMLLVVGFVMVYNTTGSATSPPLSTTSRWQPHCLCLSSSSSALA